MALFVPVKIDKVILPSGAINAATNARISLGLERLLQHAAGHPHPMSSLTLSQKPIISFDTPEIATVLADCAFAGAQLANVAVYLKIATATSNTARATEAHFKLTMAISLMTVPRLQLPHNQAGSIGCELRPEYNGSVDPIVFASSQALSGNLAAPNTYGLGPVLLNNTAVTGHQDLTIETSYQLIQEGHSSQVWDGFVGIETVVSKAMCSTKKGAFNFSTLGLGGVTLDGSNGFECYARHLRSAADSSNHIYFQATHGFAYGEEGAVNGRTGLMDDRFAVDCIASSDSVTPIVGTTGADITPEV